MNLLPRACSCAAVLLLAAAIAAAQDLEAGYARREITPREPTPMWGYADRHDALSAGIRDPLFADVLVLQAGTARFALIGLDLGRPPNEASLQTIRRRLLEKAGISASILTASHTHHGPVMELRDEPEKGRGKFDATLRYYRQLEDALVDAAAEAAGRLQPVRLAAGSLALDRLNRNRHTRKEPKPVDPQLTVLRLDASNGKPVALVVNFAAHPTSLPSADRRFSADYVGALKDLAARESGAGIVFVQGAEGDQSTNRAGLDYRQYGERLGQEAIRLSKSLQLVPSPPASIQVREKRFRFESRIPHGNPLVRFVFSRVFFPELVAAYVDEYAAGIRPRLTVALINRKLAFVGVSGEVFAAHAIRLKAKAPVGTLIFCGLANGYHQYFPTREAIEEGGYGAKATEAPGSPGAGEQIMDQALAWLHQMTAPTK